MIGKTRHAPGPARGVLHPRPAQGDFHHARIAPEPALAEWVEHFWSVAWDLRGQPPQVQETLPHPSVHIVVEGGRGEVLGVHTGRFTRVLEGRGRVFGIKFKPGGFRPFLPAPVASLMNAARPLRELFGATADRYTEDVLACDDDAGRVDAAQRFLQAHRPAHDPQVALVSALVAGIAEERELTGVEAVAARCGLGTRALQRLFSEYVGASPKWVIQRYRLHEAVAQVQAGTAVSWAALAQSLGYFDQAHFIRDFKRLVGRTPADFARATQRAAAGPAPAMPRSRRR